VVFVCCPFDLIPRERILTCHNVSSDGFCPTFHDCIHGGGSFCQFLTKMSEKVSDLTG